MLIWHKKRRYSVILFLVMLASSALMLRGTDRHLSTSTDPHVDIRPVHDPAVHSAQTDTLSVSAEEDDSMRFKSNLLNGDDPTPDDIMDQTHFETK